MFNDNFNVFVEFVSCMNEYIEVLYVCTMNTHLCTININIKFPRRFAVSKFGRNSETPFFAVSVSAVSETGLNYAAREFGGELRENSILDESFIPHLRTSETKEELSH